MNPFRLLVFAAIGAFGGPSKAISQAPVRPTITVTIPAGAVTRTDTDGTSTTYFVSVGTGRYHTPRGHFQVTEITWNPDWHPPKSAWASDRRHAPPGNNNPMGRVKMRFDDLLFFHGTPPAEMAHLGRPASHGCVRMANEDAWDLARWLVSAGGADIADSTISALESSPGKTRVRELFTPVDVIVRYPVADIVDDQVQIYPDPYAQFTPLQRRQELTNVLASAGITPDPGAISAALAAANQKTAIWPLLVFTDTRPPSTPLQPTAIGDDR